MPVTNEEIAAIFEDMATLLEMKGDSIFKIRAYQRAARTIGELSFTLEQGVKDQVDLKKIPGIGKAISDKIQEYCQSGGIGAYDRLVAELPDGVLTMMSIPGVGPKTALLIARELGVSTIEGVEKEIHAGKLAALPGLGSKTAETILRHIRVMGSKDGRTPIGPALSVAEATVDYLREQCPDLGELLPAGSLRRWEETIGDIDLVGTSSSPEAVSEALVSLPGIQEVLGRGPKKTSVVLESGIQVDLRIGEEDSFGALLQYFTGS
ncbi:MAG: DNA polymerase III, partial [Chloroflexi bacterium]|nr:DNA polymerase III [Chloroflexota bacterium]